MKISNMPKQFAAELLLFLAEHENFSSVEKLLGDEVAVEEVRALFREISSGLMEETLKELKENKNGVSDNVYISPQTRSILSHLSPQDEYSLLEIFGILEKP